MDRIRARDWFTKPNRDFNEVCEQAELNPVMVRKYVLPMIAAAENQEPPAPQRVVRRPKRRDQINRQLVTYEHDGKRMTAAAWADELGITKQTIYTRLSKGWPYSRVFTGSANRQCNPKRIEHQGRSLTINEWAAESGIDGSVIRQRLKLGWTIERAITTPAKRRTRGVGSNTPNTLPDRATSVAQARV
jgi:hypothetical protein